MSIRLSEVVETTACVSGAPRVKLVPTEWYPTRGKALRYPVLGKSLVSPDLANIYIGEPSFVYPVHRHFQVLLPSTLGLYIILCLTQTPI